MIVFVVAQDMAAATKIARQARLKNSDWTFVRSPETFVKVMGESEPDEVVVLIHEHWREKPFISEMALAGMEKDVTKTYPIADAVEALTKQGARMHVCS